MVCCESDCSGTSLISDNANVTGTICVLFYCLTLSSQSFKDYEENGVITTRRLMVYGWLVLESRGQKKMSL